MGNHHSYALNQFDRCTEYVEAHSPVRLSNVYFTECSLDVSIVPFHVSIGNSNYIYSEKISLKFKQSNTIIGLWRNIAIGL